MVDRNQQPFTSLTQISEYQSMLSLGISSSWQTDVIHMGRQMK
jgi:hypothetical protein